MVDGSKLKSTSTRSKSWAWGIIKDAVVKVYAAGRSSCASPNAFGVDSHPSFAPRVALAQLAVVQAGKHRRANPTTLNRAMPPANFSRLRQQTLLPRN